MSASSELERLEEMQRLLLEVSELNSPEPATVYRQVMAILSEFYDNSTVLLSIQRSDYLDFKAIVGPKSSLHRIGGNAMKDSYCQYAIRDLQPILIQNAKREPQYKGLRPARAGFCRYLGVPVCDSNGSVLGTLCILDGKTDEPLGQADIRFISLLAVRVSTELAREALKEAQERLLEGAKLKAVGTLSASVAHDIRNIVASLCIEIQCGQDDPVQTLQIVKERLDRFNLLCHRLLSYSQPQAAARTEVDLNDVIQHVVDLTAPQARMMNVEMRFKRGTLRTLQGDPARLEHLFVNLVLNALKSMDGIGGDLVLVSKQDRNGATVQVVDAGCGIPKQISERLFRPFTSNNPQGFGLGLYSCKKIVDDHGGTIHARRRLGRGTVFTVCLPEGSDL